VSGKAARSEAESMKTLKSNSTSQEMAGEVQLARSHLAKAESQRKSAKEQARLAKRRRRKAKEAARRARKQSKLAKRAVAEAKRVLAEAEKKLNQLAKRNTVTEPVRKATKPAATPSPKSKKPKKAKPGSSIRGAGSRPTDQMGRGVEPIAPTSPAPSSNQPPIPSQTAA
jgi:hypothetical protein